MNNNKKNVLVFPSPVYPALQVIDCLKHCLQVHVIAGASYSNHAEYICDDTICDMPYITSEGFLDYLIGLVHDRAIDLIIPTDDTAALFLSEHAEEIPAKVVCSPYETAKICRYKSLTYEVLKGKSYIPKAYSVDEIDQIEDYPVFIKPDIGAGSRGATKIYSAEQLKNVKELENYVICEYLPGEEYTIDCFTNKDRSLLFCNPRVRSRLINGKTGRGHNVALTDEMRAIIESLNESIVFRGYWFAQLKRDAQGKLKLLEICTRFSGSFVFSKSRGVNLPLLAVCDFSGIPADVVVNDYEVECDKSYIDRIRISYPYNHLYIDFDDTITSEGGKNVNPYVMAYLYQCRAKNIKISLISRHAVSKKESLEDAFSRLCISKDLFDEIIELDWDELKSNKIEDVSKSIFLDNSFKERKEVHDKLGIPVFDLCNLDALFDWRA